VISSGVDIAYGKEGNTAFAGCVCVCVCVCVCLSAHGRQDFNTPPKFLPPGLYPYVLSKTGNPIGFAPVTSSGLWSS
jgi:hypothetical protein